MDKSKLLRAESEAKVSDRAAQRVRLLLTVEHPEQLVPVRGAQVRQLSHPDPFEGLQTSGRDAHVAGDQQETLQTHRVHLCALHHQRHVLLSVRQPAVTGKLR